jgi:hypothetical protein
MTQDDTPRPKSQRRAEIREHHPDMHAPETR